MRSDRVAEWILSLVTAPERAASAAGDLMEEAVTRGRVWFWLYVARTTITLLWRNITEAPLRMAGLAVAGWFVYMTVSVILWFALFVSVTLLWGTAFFLTHHTGLELLANVLRIRFDWPPPPPGATRWIEPLVMILAAPIHIGRFTARCWQGREFTAWVMMSLLWPFLSVYVPFTAASTRVNLPMMPLIQTSVLLGVLWERRSRSTDSLS